MSCLLSINMFQEWFLYMSGILLLDIIISLFFIFHVTSIISIFILILFIY